MICSLRKQVSERRFGFVTLEMIVAATVLGMLLALVVPALQGLKQADQALARRDFAQRELRNLVEKARLQERPEVPALPLWVTEELPQAELQLQQASVALDGNVTLTRSTFVLQWSEATGMRSAQLSWWRPTRLKGAVE